MEALSKRVSLFGEEHFGKAQLGDNRLTNRLVSAAERLVQHPHGSLPDKFQNPADLNGFYNWMANPKITHAKAVAPHAERTLGLMRQEAGIVLILTMVAGAAQRCGKRS